jgi:hypothetical protein
MTPWEEDTNTETVGGRRTRHRHLDDGRVLTVWAVPGGWLPSIRLDDRNAPEWTAGPILWADLDTAQRAVERAAGVRQDP